MKTLPFLPFLLAGLLLSACSGLKPQSFANEQPRFEPERYFDGRVDSWGVFESPGGEPQRRFTAIDIGHREGGVLVLDQTFTYDNGEIQKRHWRIRPVSQHDYEATANDVVGTAHGTAYGNAFLFEYTVALKPGNPLYNVHLRQWMYLQAGGATMMNSVAVTKLGIRLATVAECFHKKTER